MRIVIDIPDEIYAKYAGKEKLTYLDGVVLCGKKLPKGHGRLIDADSLLANHPLIDTYPFPSTTIDHAPTIIEADKAESENKECSR